MKTHRKTLGTVIMAATLLGIGALHAVGFRSGHSSTKTMCYKACSKHYDHNSSSFKDCMRDCIHTGVVKE
ncbi:hypothetical protein [Nitratifractor sp.]